MAYKHSDPFNERATYETGYRLTKLHVAYAFVCLFAALMALLV